VRHRERKLHIESYWAAHTAESGRTLDVYQAVEARRCTVQLSSGRLYLDAVASPATALLGHDLPPLVATDEAAVKRMLSTLVPGYVCFAMTQSSGAASDLALRVVLSATDSNRRVAQVNAFEAEPGQGEDFLVAYENETLGRTGSWLASMTWNRAPDLVVVGEALALGYPFGAVLARDDFVSSFDATGSEPSPVYPPAISLSGSRSPKRQTGGHGASRFAWLENAPTATPAALERVAAAVATVGREGLLEQGRNLANYFQTRLLAIRASAPQLEDIKGTGLSVRIALASPLRASQIRRRMCERGVLTGVDAAGRLAIDLSLAMRIAEIDVITGALRASILNQPPASASACCAACHEMAPS
jgi:acetylornithine/succinyldiaminopimelate/putrescine aminotransferase